MKISRQSQNYVNMHANRSLVLNQTSHLEDLEGEGVVVVAQMRPGALPVATQVDSEILKRKPGYVSCVMCVKWKVSPVFFLEDLRDNNFP